MRKRGRLRGLTLAELVAAMAITAVIGLAVTGVASSIANLNQEAEEYYEFLQSGRTAADRLQKIVRSSLLVTAAGESDLVLWEGDENGDGKINASEVTQISLQGSSGKLVAGKTKFPADMTAETRESLDSRLSLADVTSLSQLDLGPSHAAYADKQVLARDVKSFKVSLDEAAPNTRLVKFEIVIGDDNQVITQYGAAKLRAPNTGRVVSESGVYMLLD